MAPRKSSIPRSFSRISNKAARAIVSKGGELKLVDEIISVAGIDATSTTGSIFCINAVSQGTGLNERIGAKIHLKSVMIRAIFTTAFSAAANITQGQVIRVMLVRQDDGGAIPLLSDIVALTTTAAGVPIVTANRFAGKNLLSANQYKILVDEKFAIKQRNGNFDPVATGACIEYQTTVWDKYLDLSKMNFLTRFQATASPPTVAQIAEGSLLLVMIAEKNSTQTSTNVDLNR